MGPLENIFMVTANVLFYVSRIARFCIASYSLIKSLKGERILGLSPKKEIKKKQNGGLNHASIACIHEVLRTLVCEHAHSARMSFCGTSLQASFSFTYLRFPSPRGEVASSQSQANPIPVNNPLLLISLLKCCHQISGY